MGVLTQSDLFRALAALYSKSIACWTLIILPKKPIHLFLSLPYWRLSFSIGICMFVGDQVESETGFASIYRRIIIFFNCLIGKTNHVSGWIWFLSRNMWILNFYYEYNQTHPLQQEKEKNPKVCQGTISFKPLYFSVPRNYWKFQIPKVYQSTMFFKPPYFCATRNSCNS